MQQITIYTDGIVPGNIGKGGYGVVLVSGEYKKELYEGYRMTTNNRMELIAVIKGLEALKSQESDVVVYSDSRYVVDPVEKKWLQDWIKKGFKGKKNSDLWKRFWQLSSQHKVQLCWKEHCRDPFAERCEQLAHMSLQRVTQTDIEFEKSQMDNVPVCAENIDSTSLNKDSISSQIVIYTDGAASGNPGPGGYGVVLTCGPHVKELSEGFRLTTNNRMELLAVIKGLEALKNDGCDVVVYSDSRYVVDAVEKHWLEGWIKKGFKGKKNPDLWMRFWRVYNRHHVVFQWVKGHDGIPLNERCDQLATTSAAAPTLVDEGYENQQNDNTLTI